MARLAEYLLLKGEEKRFGFQSVFVDSAINQFVFRTRDGKRGVFESHLVLHECYLRVYRGSRAERDLGD